MNSKKVTIGLDLGDRRHAGCVVNGRGGIVTEDVIPNSRECLTACAQRFPGAPSALETGPNPRGSAGG